MGLSSRIAIVKIEEYYIYNLVVTSISSANAGLSPLMIGIDIRALLIDVRFASSVSGKGAAANRTGGAHCVPAVFDASAIGFLFPNVTCQKILHRDAPYRS
jgi:hypothetical protein